MGKDLSVGVDSSETRKGAEGWPPRATPTSKRLRLIVWRDYEFLTYLDPVRVF